MNRRGQFIPMAAMMILSVSVFMVGIVNVYRISRAKLKAQNLADAVALYIASQMTQSINVVADRNETLNHLYTNVNDPNSSVAGADPCLTPNRDDDPPGLGCFAADRGAYYRFHSTQSVQYYAQMVQSMNQIQQLFAQSYDTLLGAGGTTSSNGQSSLQANLIRNMPALQDSNVQLVVFNSQGTKSNAERAAKQMLDNPNPSVGNNLYLRNLERVSFSVNKSIRVRYCSGTITCSEKTKALEELLPGATGKIGVMELATNSQAGNPASAYLDSSGSVGAGAIVTINVDLVGLPATRVQTKATAYTVMSAGSLAADKTRGGSFRPTYWVKLGKPAL